MKRILFVLVILFCSNVSFGQNTDSYWASLQSKVNQAITSKDNYALIQIEPEFDSYFSDALHRTPEVKFDYVRFKIYLGYAYIQKMELEKAEQVLLTAISFSENFPKSRKLAYSAIEHCYSYKAMEKEAHDNYKDAIQYSLLAISYAEMAGKAKQQVEQYIILGREYTYTQQFDKAQTAFSEAEKRIPAIPDSMTLLMSSFRLTAASACRFVFPASQLTALNTLPFTSLPALIFSNSIIAEGLPI